MRGGSRGGQPPAGFRQDRAAHAAGAARPAAAAAGLAGQVGPGAGQAGQAVLVLGQFDLQDAFAGVGMLGEDVQDQRCAVEDADILAEAFLQLAQVARGKLIVEDDHLGQGFFDQCFDLFNFSRPDIMYSGWACPAFG